MIYITNKLSVIIYTSLIEKYCFHYFGLLGTICCYYISYIYYFNINLRYNLPIEFK